MINTGRVGIILCIHVLPVWVYMTASAYRYLIQVIMIALQYNVWYCRVNYLENIRHIHRYDGHRYSTPKNKEKKVYYDWQFTQTLCSMNRSIEYLHKLHDHAVKKWFDPDIISHGTYYDKSNNIIHLDLNDTAFFVKEWSYKKLSDTDYIIADYYPYLSYLLSKWSTLPKL